VLLGSADVDINQKYCAWLLYVACLVSLKVLSLLVYNKNIFYGVIVVQNTAPFARALLLFLQETHALLSL